jgi:SpoVK/Ycf46/Vps4 family AAA+-type ATPase
MDDSHKVGIVERRQGDLLTVRFPDDNNRREKVPRREVRALADILYEARKRGAKYKNNFSLTGGSTLAELVEEFGYSTQQLRSESREKVVKQLQRAGLEVHPETDRWSRDDRFKLVLTTDVSPESPDTDDGILPSPQLLPVKLPELFWPTTLGLDPNRELVFLRALAAPDPILCLLHIPDDSDMHGWLQATWEGLMSWAFHAAQRFRRLANTDFTPEVLIGRPAMLQTYVETSALSVEAPRLRDKPHALNLISLKKESDSPVDVLHLRAAWPGPVFDFRPQPSKSPEGQLSEDVRALLECLLLVAGSPAEVKENLSPLKTLLWSKEASIQILARASINLGEVLSSGELPKFKGSNENATALALKADLAQWVKRAHKDAILRFEENLEENQTQEVNAYGDVYEVHRIDLFVEGQGRFEVETLVGSGPMEAFYHQKVFARVNRDCPHLWLVIPNEAVLWAGPYLADLAHHLGSCGRVLIPGLGEAYLEFQGRPLGAQEIEVPWDELRKTSAISIGKAGVEETPLRLKDIAGYKEIRERVEELIIWPEKHRRALRRPSRSSGILFFGPPGCGKSRLARAIAGELEQEVRLLSPSDLRGAYVGWGQVMIREQFDWVAEHENRMLVIDEIDAVARSRREIGNMHSDEKANVNELLVQLDRVSRLGRLIVGTTNFVESLDDAVVRSGRFGRFIPIAPPDIDEAIDILNYYLKSLTENSDLDNQPRVQVPEAKHLRSILEPLFAENAREHRFFCGADLEEAVNRTYQRCVRQALGDAWPEDYTHVNVNLTPVELTRSLKDVARSVTEEATEQFIKDVKRFCGSSIANQFFKRFCVEA